MIRRLLVALIRAYRYLLSPWWGRSCRFEPTCSAYAIEALERHGTVRRREPFRLTVELLECALQIPARRVLRARRQKTRGAQQSARDREACFVFEHLGPRAWFWASVVHS